MKVFITGGTGTVGQHFTKRLLDEGNEVVLLTRTPERIPALKNIPGLKLIKGRMQDFHTIEKALDGCDAVVHIAVSIEKDPLSAVENDTKATAFLLTASEKAGVKDFIYTSSVTAIQGAVSDRVQDGVLDETSQIRPFGVYGALKAAGEAYVNGFDEYFITDGPMKSVSMRRNIVRPGNIFADPAFEGGATDSFPMIEILAGKILNNEDVVLPANDGGFFASGQQIAELYMKILQSGVHKQTFICGGKKFITYADIARKIKDKIPESGSSIIETGSRKHVVISSRKMENYFGISFDGDEYLDDHISWIVDHLKKKRNGEDVPDFRHADYTYKF